MNNDVILKYLFFLASFFDTDKRFFGSFCKESRDEWQITFVVVIKLLAVKRNVVGNCPRSLRMLVNQLLTYSFTIFLIYDIIYAPPELDLKGRLDMRYGLELDGFQVLSQIAEKKARPKVSTQLNFATTQ